MKNEPEKIGRSIPSPYFQSTEVRISQTHKRIDVLHHTTQRAIDDITDFLLKKKKQKWNSYRQGFLTALTVTWGILIGSMITRVIFEAFV